MIRPVTRRCILGRGVRHNPGAVGGASVNRIRPQVFPRRPEPRVAKRHNSLALVTAPTPKTESTDVAREPWHTFSPIGLAMVNTTGSLFTLAAAATHDHLALRALAGMGALCVVSFNALMPKPLKTHQQTAAGWGMMFAALHFVNLGILLREQHSGISLSDEEEDIYEHGFQRFGVTPRQFQKLLAAGARFVDYGPGETLAELGKPVDKVLYVTHGSCLGENGAPGCVVIEYHQDVFIGELHPRRWRAEYLGCGESVQACQEQDLREQDDLEDAWLVEHAEASAKRQRSRSRDMRKMLMAGLEERSGSLTRLCTGSAWKSTIKAGPTGCRILAWPLGAFTCAVGAEEKLCKAMEQADEMGLASKICAGSSRKALDGYLELLQYCASDGQFQPAEKHALHRYRARHAVPDAEHERMLGEIGWTKAEYEDGILNSKWNTIMGRWRQKRSSQLPSSPN